MRCTQESDGENTYEEVDHMSLLQALLLGLVQGITEFLPVSSSGHLAIMQNLLNINTDTGVLFDVILHLGTLTAIFIAFWKDIKKLILDGCGMIYDIIQNIKIWSHNRREHDARRYRKIVSSNYRKFILLITVSTIPTAIVGLLLQNVVETAGSNLLAPGVGLFILLDRAGYRLFSGNRRISGNLQVRYDHSSLSALRSQQKICSKIFIYHVHSGCVGGSSPGIEGHTRLGSHTSRVWGISGGSRSCRNSGVLLHQNNAAADTAQKIPVFQYLLFYHRNCCCNV